MVTFVASMIINALAENGNFGYTNAAMSFRYYTYITPPNFTFIIWAVIYSFWAFFIIFQMFSNTCLSNPRSMYSNWTKGKIYFSIYGHADFM